ncbi:MAG TPA: hypothetical protein VIX87_10005 [Steroidobacteraceae bacterium]
MHTDTAQEPPAGTGEADVAPPPRLGEVLKVIKLELVTLRLNGRERGRGFNPYDGQLGRASRDPWSRRRRA